MAEDDPERDEEWFNEVYGKKYTGPTSSSRRDAPKRPIADRDDEEEEEAPRDPNAVPTDFTSREAKVWEAKAKAIERNWKRRKEEELHCKLCGEAGHFAQGCPTTLGGNRKSGEVVHRLPLNDKRLKPRLIGTGGSVIQGLEKDTGCRLRLEDNRSGGDPGAFFVRVSGPDRATVNKAVAIVKKLVTQVEDDWKSRKPFRSPSSSVLGSEYEHRLVGRRAVLPDFGRYEHLPETLEELERAFVQEAVELRKEQTAEEDRELSRHHESLRSIHERYQQRLTDLTVKQARQREEFLQIPEGYTTYERGYTFNQGASYEYAAGQQRKPFGPKPYENRRF